MSLKAKLKFSIEIRLLIVRIRFEIEKFFR